MRVLTHYLDLPLVEATHRTRCRGFGPGPLVATVTSDLDLPAIPDFEAAVTAAIDEAPGTLVVDLSRVDFVGVPGIGALIAAQDHADRSGVAMLLVPGHRTLRRVLTVVGLADHFTCYPSVRAAVAARRAELAAHADLDEPIGLHHAQR